MNKSQKWVVNIALLVIIISVLIPTFNQYKTVITDNSNITIITGTGWNFVWKINKTSMDGNSAVTMIEYYKIRFDILILELIGIIALGGFFFLLFKKN